jgi:tetratricopeptide (TPR) repeat protein
LSEKNSLKEMFVKDKSFLLSIILIIVLGFAVYSNSLNGKFVWDDKVLVRDNPYIRSFSNITDVFTKNIGKGAGINDYSYRPVQLVTYMVDYLFWKLKPVGYHFTNVFLHILAALSIYGLILLLFKDKLLSFLASIFFVTHPIHTEAVSYISGRADSLAVIFMMVCFTLYVKQNNLQQSFKQIGDGVKCSTRVIPAKETRCHSREAQRCHSRESGNPGPAGIQEINIVPAEKLKAASSYVFMLISFMLALFSRENSLILPLLLLLYHYVFRKKIRIKLFLSLLSIAVMYVLVRCSFLKFSLPHVNNSTTLIQRMPGFFDAVTNYIKLLILPLRLHMEYGDKLFAFSDFRAIVGVLTILALLIYIFRQRRVRGLAFFSIMWFLVALLPSSNLYPLNAYMAEHWLYLPSVGFFLVLAKILSTLYTKTKNKIGIITVILVIVVLNSGLTLRQNVYWKEPIALYEMTLKYAPDSAGVYNNLGIAYKEKGAYDAALGAYNKAISLEPADAYAYNNLAVIYANMGRKEKAQDLYEKAIEINPVYVDAYYNLGNSYAYDGEYKRAITYYEKAVKNNPNHIDAYYNLGIAYNSIGFSKKAIDVFNEIIKIDSDNAGAYFNLGNVYAGIGEDERAIKAYKAAVENNPEYAQGYNNLAALYLRRKQFALAAANYRKAVKLGFENPVLGKQLTLYIKEK